MYCCEKASTILCAIPTPAHGPDTCCRCTPLNPEPHPLLMCSISSSRSLGINQPCSAGAGAWEAGRRHGHGLCLFADGTKFEGQWEWDVWVQTAACPKRTTVEGWGSARAVAGFPSNFTIKVPTVVVATALFISAAAWCHFLHWKRCLGVAFEHLQGLGALLQKHTTCAVYAYF